MNKTCGYVCGPNIYGSFKGWTVVAAIGLALAVGFVVGQLIK